MIQEEKPLKAGKKLLALLLTVCMLLCMLPTVAFASGSDYLKIAMLDSGRKYFSADWVKAFLYEAKADGYTHVMLAVGNDGMRFLLDDMSLTVGGKTYSSNAVASAIRAGNNAYTTASSGEWTESEMDEFFATAKKAGIEIIPLLNSPGHMDSVLYAASSLTGTNCGYNGSKTDRPAYQKLLEAIRTDQVSDVIVFDLSRLNRDFDNQRCILLEMKAHGVILHCIRERRAGLISSVFSEYLIERKQK